MKKILITIFVLINALVAYDNYDSLSLKGFRSHDLKLSFVYEVDPKYPNDSKYPDLIIKEENKTILSRYAYEDNKPEVKFVYYDEKRNIIAILVGWRTIHRAAGINGEFYKLDVFKKFLKQTIKLKTISGIDGHKEGNKIDKNTGYTIGEPAKFKYKTKNAISKLVEKMNILKAIQNQIKNKEINASLSSIQELLFYNKITQTTLTPYNNIAYYLQKAGANEEAAYLLEKIIAKFPNRTVAYYNLGDAYWALGEKKKAIKAYTTYIEQMCHKSLQKKIPKKVLERVKDKR